MKNKVIFFDIDYTLFNTEAFRNRVYQKLQQLTLKYSLEEIIALAMRVYDNLREAGSFKVRPFSEEFVRLSGADIPVETVEAVWWDRDILLASLYGETEETLQALEKKGIATLGIFSSGGKLQREKIHTLTHFFKEEHIHIHMVKDDHLPQILPRYEGKQIFFIDDYIPVLEKIKAFNPHIITIWIKRGRLAEKFVPSETFSPDFTIATLHEVFPIIDSFDKR